MIREALKENESKVWENITVFFLADEQISWMSGKESLEDRLQKKKTAMDELKDILKNHTKQWEILEYDRPFYFASYWDWDKPGGRVHISPYIWGTDEGVCPGLDESDRRMM